MGVQDPIWTSHSLGTNTLSLSFYPAPAIFGGASAGSLYVKINPSGPGTIELLASTQAAFLLTPIHSIPTISSRFRLRYASSLLYDQQVHHCGPQIAETNACLAHFWPLASFDTDSLNSLTGFTLRYPSYSVSYSSDLGLPPSDLDVAPQLLARRTYRPNTFGAFWLRSFFTLRLEATPTWPPRALLPGPLFGLVFNNMLVGGNGMTVADPTTQFTEANYEYQCDGDRYLEFLNIVSPLLQDKPPSMASFFQVGTGSVDFLSSFLLQPTNATLVRLNQPLQIDQAFFSDTVTNCTTNITTSMFEYFRANLTASDHNCHQITPEAFAVDPCCNLSLQYDQCCLETTFTVPIDLPGVDTNTCVPDDCSYPKAAPCSSPYCSLADLRLIESVTSNTIFNPERGCAAFLNFISYTSTALFASPECITRIFNSNSSILGRRCSSDADCEAMSSTCDMLRQQCRLSSTQLHQTWFQCVRESMPSLTFQALLSMIGLPANATSEQFLDVYQDNLQESGYLSCHVDTDASLSIFDDFYAQMNLDPQCQDELDLAGTPGYSHFQLFQRRSFPFYPPDLAPSDACLRRVWLAGASPSECNSSISEMCNWHSCVGCTPEQCRQFCLAGDLAAVECSTASLPSEPAQPSYFCGVCDSVGYCQPVLGVTSEAECTNTTVCEMPDGRITACPVSPTTTTTTTTSEGQCSEMCPGDSCLSLYYGRYGACFSFGGSQSECEAVGGAWTNTNMAACRHFRVAFAEDCPYTWLQCHNLTLSQCQQFAQQAENELLGCFVAPWRECRSATECSESGGRCRQQAADSWYAMPRQLDAMGDSSPFDPSLWHNNKEVINDFQNIYVFPPVWGVCVFSGYSDFWWIDATRVCKQHVPTRSHNATMRNSSLPVPPRKTVAEGCIDYWYLTAAECQQDGGVWREPYQTQAACEGNSGYLCYSALTNSVTGTDCCPELGGPDREASASRAYQWQAGKWQQAQVRRPRWLARQYGNVRSWQAATYERYLSTSLSMLSRSMSSSLQSALRVCYFGSVINPMTRVVCDCRADNLTDKEPFCFRQGVLVSESSFPMCDGFPTVFAWYPISVSQSLSANFNSTAIPDIGYAICVEIGVTLEQFRAHFVGVPQPTGILSSPDFSYTDRLKAAANSHGRLVGYLVGDGVEMSVQESFFDGHFLRVKLGDLGPMELCFLVLDANLAELANQTAHGYSVFDLAVPHPTLPNLLLPLGLEGRLDNSSTQQLLSTAPPYVCFDDFRFQGEVGRSYQVKLLPILRLQQWQATDSGSSDPNDLSLSSWGVGLYGALLGCYGLCIVQLLVCLTLFFAFQRAPPTASHVVLVGLLLFMTVRVIYFGLLVGDYALSATSDFALIELPLFVLAMTFVVMLINWARFLKMADIFDSAQTTWLLLLLLDMLLALIYIMFVVLFYALPSAAVEEDAYACFQPLPPAARSYQRSDAQMNVQIACHTFIVFVSLLLACLFAWAAYLFVSTLPPQTRSLHLFRFTRASKIATPAQQSAKLFQTILALTFFFASDSIFLLIFYLFTSFQASPWAAIVLFFFEVLPCIFLVYQMHPKWTLKPIYAGAKSLPSRYPSTDHDLPSGSSASAASSAALNAAASDLSSSSTLITSPDWN